MKILKHRRQGNCVDPDRLRPFDQGVSRSVTSMIVIADDIEPTQGVVELKGGEMCCGKGGGG